MDVNGLLPHIDIVYCSDNENEDVKGGKGENTSADEGHRHEEKRKYCKPYPKNVHPSAKKKISKKK